jgi:starch synthase
MKVAFLSFGFGEYCVRLASAVAHHADTLLLLPDEEADPYLYMLSEGVCLHRFNKPRLRQPLRQLGMVAHLLRCLENFNPDVIHIQTGHLWFNLALPMLRRYPLVLTVHDPFRHRGDAQSRKTPQWILDVGCRRACEIIVHVPQMKEVVVQRLRIPEHRVHVIPHVVCGDASAQADVSEEGELVLFFGRIWEYKGLEYLIRAEPLITAQVPQAKIVIAGTGERLDRYRRMMVHPDRFIIYDEYVSDEKRAELFRRSSVVVLPYIEATQSGVIPVAHSFGKPVVATTVGGLPAQVDNGINGYLVPPRDEGALADAIVHLLRHPSIRRQLGANGKRRMAVECSAEQVARETLTVYQLAAAAGSRRQ